MAVGHFRGVLLLQRTPCRDAVFAVVVLLACVATADYLVAVVTFVAQSNRERVSESLESSLQTLRERPERDKLKDTRASRERKTRRQA